jgi:transmembrane sensor
MSEDQFWNLLAKKLSGQTLLEEEEELKELMKKYPDLLYAAQHIEDIWGLKSYEDQSDPEEAFALHLEKLTCNTDFPSKELEYNEKVIIDTDASINRKQKKWIITSLIFICIMGLAGFLWLNQTRKSNPLQIGKGVSEITTRFGSKTKLILPDSSLVWLNSGSKLVYNEHFGSMNREVELSGEAYFDVKKSEIPFIIHTNAIKIKVLGTAFNVKSYPDEKSIETSLFRGKVEITIDKRPDEKYVLKPNQKLVISNETYTTKKPEALKEPLIVLSRLKLTNDSTIAEMSWVENKLVFEDEVFSELAKRMERWYNVTIEIKDDKIAQLHLNGTFENETIHQALTALQIATPFNFTVNQNHITITQ